MGNEIARMADVAMYEAESDYDSPNVTLLSMTDQPLREIAAAADMYAGRVVHSTHEVSRTKAELWIEEMMRTKTRAPLEFVQFHFLFEGVTRGFTHQLVRQRTATYVQESTRFAVKRNAIVAMPPSISRLKDDAPARVVWESTVHNINTAYNALIDSGIPAEDARGLLPTNTTTKVHYRTNLRDLLEHSGMRLCSQAQYEWKQVWAGIIYAIRNYPLRNGTRTVDFWQYDLIAQMFGPVCYQTGKCEFMATTDRACTIRDRVQAHYARGEGPEYWTDINKMEPLMEGAARVRPGEQV